MAGCGFESHGAHQHKSLYWTPGKILARRVELKIALVANEKFPGSDPEYDPPETLEALRQAIAQHGHKCFLLEADPSLPQHLTTNRPDLVFNIAEGPITAGRNRESLVPALCDLLHIPYTGPDAWTATCTLDKQQARLLVSQSGVRVARGGLFGHVRIEGLPLPLVVKPAAEGSSKGITASSLCRSYTEARQQAILLSEQYGSVLVECYVAGQEHTVALVGNGESLRVLGSLEVQSTGTDAEWLYGREQKLDSEHLVRYLKHTDPDHRLAQAAKICFKTLGCRDWARLDFRLDQDGTPVFIEANPLPGLDPLGGDFVMASCTPYLDLIGQCLQASLARHGMVPQEECHVLRSHRSDQEPHY